MRAWKMLVAGLAMVSLFPSAVSAQDVWIFENLERPRLIKCASEARVAGFEYDNQNRPVLAWREDDGCGFPGHTYWTRREGSIWNTTEFFGLNDFAHQFIVRPSDGTPFMVSAAAGSYSSQNTYRDNLSSFPAGGERAYLEPLVGGQQCAYPEYSLAFGPDDENPTWGTSLAQCGGRGPIRLSGETIEPDAGRGATSVARGPDGIAHMVWFGGGTSTFPGGVFYTQGPQLDPAVAWRGPGIQLLSNVFVSSAGADVQLRIDRFGVLHAVARVPDPVEGWGRSWYFRSTDNGHTWSDPEAMVGAWAQQISLAVDEAGIPSIAYWNGWTQLRYARRDPVGGSWPSQLITPTFHRVAPSPRLTFDPDNSGRPVVAFFDGASRMLKAARPAWPGDEPAADLALSVAAAPSPVFAGQQQLYTIDVLNQGPRHTTDTLLTVTLPAEVTFVSATPAPLSQTGQTLTFNSWSVSTGSWGDGHLTAGATGVVKITVTVVAPAGPMTLRTTVTSAEPERSPADNTVTTAMTVRAASCFPPSPKSWWSGDGIAIDHVAGAPTALNGGVSFTPGRVGKAFLLNGADAWISSGYSNNDNYHYPRLGSFSMSAWIRTSKTTGSQTIASKWECAFYCRVNVGYFFQVADGRLFMAMRDASGGVSSVSGVSGVADGLFHHVAVVRDVEGAQLSLYVDGQLDASVSLLGGAIGDIGTPGDNDLFGIGSTGEFNTQNRVAFFEGAIDDIAWYDSALTEAQAAALAAAPDSPGCFAPDPAPTAVITGPTEVGFGEPAVFSGAESFDTGGGHVHQYIWQLDDGASVATDLPTIDINAGFGAPLAGRHMVRLVVADEAGNQSLPVTATLVIVDTAAPTAVITGPPVAAFGAPVVFSGADSFDTGGGRILRYEWKLDARASILTEVATIDLNAPPFGGLLLGPHTLNLVVRDDSGNNSRPIEMEFYVIDTGLPTAVITGPELVELGAPTIFSAAGSFDAAYGASLIYFWSLDGGDSIRLEEGGATIDFNESPFRLSLGRHIVQLVAADLSANFSLPVTAEFVVTDVFTSFTSNEAFVSGTVLAARVPAGDTASTFRLRVGIETAWRWDAEEFGQTRPVVGQRLTAPRLNWAGPGGFEGRTPLTMTVGDVAGADNYFTALSGYDLDVPRVAGEHRLWIEGCCRLGTLADGNASRPFRVEALVSLSPSGSLSSVRTTAPPLHRVRATEELQAPISASTPGSPVSFSISPAEASGLLVAQPAGLTMNSGILQWRPTTVGLHALQVTASAEGARSAIDFLIQVDPPPHGVSFSAPPPVSLPMYAGNEIRFDVELADTDPVHRLQLDAGEFAYAITFDPPLGTEGPSPFRTTVAFTPTTEAAMSAWFLCFQGRDEGGATTAGQACITFAPPPPTVSISSASHNEDDYASSAMQFSVILSRPAPAGASVDFSTVSSAIGPGFATPGVDYAPTSGSLTFLPGQTSGTVLVNINADTEVEPSETFIVRLSNPVSAILGSAEATGVIYDGLACNGHGFYSQSAGVCACEAGFNGPSCQYSNALTCSAHGTARFDGSCGCDLGYSGASCQVAPPVFNTTKGTNVRVNDLGPGGEPGASITFAAVSVPGNTTVIWSPTDLPPSPSGFALGGLGLDVSTTAVYTPPIQICVPYRPSDHANPATLQFMHFEGGQWVDRTSFHDSINGLICATVSSLSPFGVFEPIPREGAMAGGGGIDAAGAEHRFEFSMSARRIGEERGQLHYAIKRERGRGRHEERKETDVFKATSFESLVFWDDPIVDPRRPRTAADSVYFRGAGSWNGEAGYSFEGRASDRGEPGRGHDRFAITVRSATGEVVTAIDAALTHGEVQAVGEHREPRDR